MRKRSKEEVIQMLRNIRQGFMDYPPFLDALDMGIEAVQADRPQGEWIDKGDYAECSLCGAHSGMQFDGVEPIPLKTNFCPNCGAKMTKGGEDE